MKTFNFAKPNSNNPIPLYMQVRDSIRSSIDSQELLPGDMIPGEKDLCEYFNVSRTVVRQALNELVNESLLVRKKGKGTFVTEPKIPKRFHQELIGFHEEMTSKGYKVKTDVVENKVVQATEKIAKVLKLQDGDKVISLIRIRYIQAKPLLLSISYLPYSMCKMLPQINLEEQSLYHVLESQLNFKLGKGTRTIGVCLSTKDQSDMLNIPMNSPLFSVESVNYLRDQTQTPIEFSISYYRGDVFNFEVELIRSKNDNATIRRNYKFL